MRQLVLILVLLMELTGCAPGAPGRNDGRGMPVIEGAHPAPTVRGFWWQTAVCSPVDDCWPAPR